MHLDMNNSIIILIIILPCVSIMMYHSYVYQLATT